MANSKSSEFQESSSNKHEKHAEGYWSEIFDQFELTPKIKEFKGWSELLQSSVEF